MQFSVIQKSQLEGARRLDAEYYQPEYLRIRNLVSRADLNAKPLVSLISRQVVTGSTPKIREPKGDGTDIYFVKTDTVRDGQIVFEEADFLPVKQNIQNSTPKGGDVLVTIIGATLDIVGRSAMVFSHYPKMNINQNVALIRPSEEISSGYLEAFLRGKYGRQQLWQQSRQTEQVNLNCREIENILVPVPAHTFQQEIEKLVQESHDCISQSVTIYNKAEGLLLEELGLKDFKLDEDLYSIVNFSDIKSVNRIDAEYFQPKYEKLIAKLKAQKARPLADVLENVPAKFNALAQPDKTFRYVELSNINGSIGIIDGYTETSGREAPSRAKRVLKKGDVIVSTVEGSLGKVALVHKEQEGCIASTGFFQFRSENLLSEVLLVIVRSFIFQNQLEQRCTGTILTAVPKDSIKDILVPILPRTTQEKIAGLVRESHAARKKAKELLEEAKRKVEELIESQAK